jgi:hypothetical protein
MNKENAVYVHMIKYYSTLIKGNSEFTKTQMNWENILPCEIIDTEDQILYDFTCIRNLK